MQSETDKGDLFNSDKNPYKHNKHTLVDNVTVLIVNIYQLFNVYFQVVASQEMLSVTLIAILTGIHITMVNAFC